MIEERVYNLGEIENIIKTTGKQATERKLRSWGIDYKCNGRGKSVVFDIRKIPVEVKFKVFCITELGVDSRIDFDKLRTFYYYYFGDKYFRDTTDTARAELMKADGYQITPQTIANYIKHLEKINFVSMVDYNYYSCTSGNLPKEISYEDYEKAWKQYHVDKIEKGKDVAYQIMIKELGGKPVRVKKRAENAFVQDVITELVDIIADDMDRIYGKKE